MANEVTLASLTAAGGGVAEVLSALLVPQLYDPTDLRSLVTFVPWNAGGSAAMTVTLDAVPGAYAAASSETVGGASNSAYTTDEFVLTIARYLRKYQVTDLFKTSGSPVTWPKVAQALSEGVGLTMTDLIAATFTSVSNAGGDAGAVGTLLTIDNIYAAAAILSAQGVVFGDAQHLAFVGAPKQLAEVEQSLRGETLAYPSTDSALSMRGPGFKFSWRNIDFYQSDSVPIAGGVAYNGCLFGQNAFAYTMGPVSSDLIPAGNALVTTPEFLLEMDRDADQAMTGLIGNIYPAVSAVLANAAVKVISII